jgi:hypothetical protein
MKNQMFSIMKLIIRESSIGFYKNIFFTIVILSFFGCKKSIEVPDPQLAGFSPARALVGDTVTIAGNNFNIDTTKTSVKFGDKAAKIVKVTSSELKVVVPKDATKGKINVTTNTKTITSVDDFIVLSIYVAGYEVSSNGKSQAKYWKNGVPVIVSDLSSYNETNSIAVSGNDVYVGGIEQIYGQTTIFNGKYWKNGVNTNFISLSNNYLDVVAMAVVGNDIYFATNEFENQKYIPKYWKNGISSALSDGSISEYVTSMAVVGTDVYAAGREDAIYAVQLQKAKYWKNGKAFVLTGGSTNEDATAINVVDKDIYVAGYETKNNGNRVAKYWKNGIPTNVVTTSTYSDARSVAVSSGNIYMAGSEIREGRYAATYWKNGIGVELATDEKEGTAEATSIAVEGNNIVVAGNIKVYRNSTDIYLAKYWRNGKVVNLSDGTNRAYATSVVIAP